MLKFSLSLNLIEICYYVLTTNVLTIKPTKTGILFIWFASFLIDLAELSNLQNKTLPMHIIEYTLRKKQIKNRFWT